MIAMTIKFALSQADRSGVRSLRIHLTISEHLKPIALPTFADASSHAQSHVLLACLFVFRVFHLVSASQLAAVHVMRTSSTSRCAVYKVVVAHA